MIKTYFIRQARYNQSGEIDWSNADSLTEFQSPWSHDILNDKSSGSPATTFKALWSHDYLYIRFDVHGNDILTFQRKDEKLEVMMSDHVKIFFMSEKGLSPYYCLEIDSLGRVLDYKAKHYRKFDFEWNWPDLEIHANQTDAGYSVVGLIPFASMNELKVLNRRVIYAGVYRANCIKLTEDEANFNWTCWANPETIKPDFHVPESFGLFVLQP